MIVSQTLSCYCISYLILQGEQSISIVDFEKEYLCGCVDVFNETVDLNSLAYIPMIYLIMLI